MGYVHRTVRARRGGGYRVIDSQKLSLRRKQAVVELEVSSSVEEDAAGRIVGFRVLEKQSGAPLESVAITNEAGDALLLTERSPGAPPRSRSIPLPADTLGPVRATETLRGRLGETGDVVELRILQPDTRSCVEQKATLGPPERVRLPDGTQKVLRRVDISGPGLESTRWVDPAFDLYKSSRRLFGESLVTIRATREQVLAQDFTSPPEVFVASFIAVTGRVPARAETARYRLTSRARPGGLSAERARSLDEAPGQTITGRTDEGVELDVRRVRPDRTDPRTRGELDEYLRANSYLQTDDPRLRARARTIAGAESDPWMTARALSEWVYRHIEEKDLHTVFASASEVLETRRGDCSEHAVLLAALCRSAGIPSRVTAGLVLREDAFVGHMWVEVYAGRWIPLDPTQEDPTVFADHIALAASSLEGTGLAELTGGMAGLIGDLEIEVLEARS